MIFPENGVGATPAAKRDPALLLLLLVGLGLGAFVAFKPAPAPAPVVLPAPVAPFVPPSPCGPNRCPRRSEESFGINFEYGCPWCSRLVRAFVAAGDYRTFSLSCGNCGNRVTFHPLRDGDQGSLGSKAAAPAKK